MKRIGILSDTHGYLEDINLVLAATADQDIDMWLHAGDFGDDARYMQEHTDIPVYAVRGNNDRVQPLEPREQLIPLEDTYIYMTHGHEVSYYNRIQKLIELELTWVRDSSCPVIAIIMGRFVPVMRYL